MCVPVSGCRCKSQFKEIKKKKCLFKLFMKFYVCRVGTTHSITRAVSSECQFRLVLCMHRHFWLNSPYASNKHWSCRAYVESENNRPSRIIIYKYIPDIHDNRQSLILRSIYGIISKQTTLCFGTGINKSHRSMRVSP